MKVLFVSSSRKGRGMSPFVKSQMESLIHNGILVNYYLIEGRGFKNYLLSINKIRKIIKTDHFDLIHAHYNLCGIVSKLALMNRNEKLVVSLMGDDLYGTYDKGDNLTHKGRLNILLSKLFIPIYDGIIIKSARMLNFIHKKHQNKVRVIPNGVDFEKFKPMNKFEAKSTLGKSENRKLILFLNDVNDPRKNYSLFTESLHYIKQDVDVMTPYPVPDDLIPVYLNACDVFVHVSKLEGSSNLVKEAIACNCKMVVTDVGDAKELLANATCAFVTGFDAEEIGKRIETLLYADCESNTRELNSWLEINQIANQIILCYKQINNNK